MSSLRKFLALIDQTSLMNYDLALIDQNNIKHKYDTVLFSRISKTFKTHIESETWKKFNHEYDDNDDDGDDDNDGDSDDDNDDDNTDSTTNYKYYKIYYTSKCIRWFTTHITFSHDKLLINYSDIEKLYSDNFELLPDVLSLSLYMEIDILYKMIIKRICEFGTHLCAIDDKIKINATLIIIKNLMAYKTNANHINIVKRIVVNILRRCSRREIYRDSEYIDEIIKICGERIMLEIYRDKYIFNHSDNYFFEKIS